MATENDEERKGAKEEKSSSEGTDLPRREPMQLAGGDSHPEVVDDEDDLPAAGQLGSSRYVIAFFFASGIACAYVLGRLLGAIWAKLAETTWVQKNATFLARVAEEDRSSYATLLGGVIAAGAVIYAYRRQDVRQWTDDVAAELQKVTWPDKTEVTNSTVVVIITGAFATLYLALLDRFWGFVTNLVYGGS